MRATADCDQPRGLSKELLKLLWMPPAAGLHGAGGHLHQTTHMEGGPRYQMLCPCASTADLEDADCSLVSEAYKEEQLVLTTEESWVAASSA